MLGLPGKRREVLINLGDLRTEQVLANDLESIRRALQTGPSCRNANRVDPLTSHRPLAGASDGDS